MRKGLLFWLWPGLMILGILGHATAAWSQTPPSDCTTPTGASGQSDNNTSGDAGNCYSKAKDLQYNTSASVRGYLQTMLTPKDHTDVFYYDFGQSSIDLNTNYCAEFTSPSGSPSPIPLSDMTFQVWKGTYGSTSAPTFVGTVTSTQGVGFNPTTKARYFFSIKLDRDNTGGQYAFTVTKKNCGGSSTITPQLDYEPTAAYKNDTYTGGLGIAQTDGKGVALRQTSDPFPLGTGGNTTTVDGSTFSFVVRSNVKPKLSSDLKLYVRKRGGSWQSWSMTENVSFTAPSNDPVPYRFYVYLGCSSSPGSISLGPGSDYQYYFLLNYDNQSIYLPPQAANGTYLDAPDCVLATDQEAPESKSQSPAYNNTGNIDVSFQSQDGPTGSASGVKETTLWYRKDGGPWKKATNAAQTGTSGTFSFSAQDGEGTYDFYTQSTDNNGNVEAAPNSNTPPDSSTVLDKTAPSGLLAPPSQGVVGQLVNIGYTSSDTGSGVAEVEMWVRHNNGTWTRVDTSANSGGLFSFIPPQPGTYDFVLRVRDKAGNWSSPPPTTNTFPHGSMNVPAPPAEQTQPEEDPNPDAGSSEASPDASSSEPNTSPDLSPPQDTNGNSNNNNGNSNNNNGNSNNNNGNSNNNADAGATEEVAQEPVGDDESTGAVDGGQGEGEAVGDGGGVGESEPGGSGMEPSSGEPSGQGEVVPEVSPSEVSGSDTGIQEQNSPGPESSDCNPPCAAGHRCNNGQCVAYDCYRDGCPTGQICRNGSCLSDPCDGAQCPPQMFCRDGQCVRSCGNVTCQNDEVCVDGTCFPNACRNQNCQTGEVCCPVAKLCKNPGQCVVDPCSKTQCPQGRVCSPYTGQCVDDPCTTIRCPGKNERCELGQCLAPKPLPGEGEEQEPGSPDSASPESSSSQESSPENQTSEPNSSDGSGSETNATAENVTQDVPGSVDQDNGVVIPNNPDQNKLPVGCHCNQNEWPTWGWFGLLVVLGLLVRRRTRSHPSP